MQVWSYDLLRTKQSRILQPAVDSLNVLDMYLLFISSLLNKFLLILNLKIFVIKSLFLSVAVAWNPILCYPIIWLVVKLCKPSTEFFFVFGQSSNRLWFHHSWDNLVKSWLVHSVDSPSSTQTRFWCFSWKASKTWRRYLYNFCFEHHV